MPGREFMGIGKIKDNLLGQGITRAVKGQRCGAI